MKTFKQWAEENKHALPTFTDAAEGEETDATKGERATAENAKRTGYSGNYPPAYVTGIYPDQYFMPKKASALVDRENMKSRKVYTPPDTAAKD